MKTWVLCGRDTYSQQEKARAILFGGVSADSFVPAFIFDGKKYFKRIK